MSLLTEPTQIRPARKEPESSVTGPGGQPRFRRWVALLLCLVLPLTSGCYSWRLVKLPLPDLAAPAEEIIVSINLIDGRQIRFDPVGGWVRGELVTGTVLGIPREFPLEEVEFFWVEREEVDFWRTVGAIVALGGVATLILFGLVEASDSEDVSDLLSF